VDKLNRKLVARRNFLARLGAVAVAYTFRSLASLPWAAPAAAADNVRMVSGNVTWPKGMTIRAGRRLRFNPNASTTVTVSGGSVVVEGELEMRPAAPGVVHTLRFTNISEAAFVGGGDVVVASDRGLWVMDSGKLNVQGTPKTPWARVVQAISVGQTTILLDRDPVGWRLGDEVAITPTERPSVEDFWKHYDLRKVAAISGRQVTVDSGCAYPHPAVNISASERIGFSGATYGAEVLNLTRDTRIEGTPGGRSHIFIRSTRPQHMSHIAIRHMGPRKETSRIYKGRPITEKVLGRWPIHLHHSGHGAHGTLIDGVVVRDAGSHAFVAHDSHGVTFRGCIAHNVFEEAYWWDLDHHTDLSKDILYEDCVASLVRHDPDKEGFRMAGFVLPASHNNTIRGCVAVGVVGARDSSGFNWPEKMHGVWDFQDNLAHNNFRHGAFVWQNNVSLNVVSGLTAYHNGGAGISHGAYSNRYHYEDCVLYGNGSGAILHALSRSPDPGLRFVRVLFGNPLRSVKHSIASTLDYPVLFDRCSFPAGVIVDDGVGKGSVFDFVNCDPLEPSHFQIAKLQPGARIRVQRRMGTAYQIDETGTKSVPNFA
jgi:hypothetical protein